MNITELTPYLAIAISLFTLAGLIKNTLTSGEKTLAKEQEEHAEKLIDLDRRVQAIESDMKHLPDRATTHRLELALAEINGRLNTLDERLKPIGATNHRLQEFLLEQAQHSKVA